MENTNLTQMERKDVSLRDLERDNYRELSANNYRELGADKLVGTILMRKMFTWMTLALIITGIAAWTVASSPELVAAIYGSTILFYGFIIAEVGLVLLLSALIDRMSLITATIMLVAYAVINGITLSYIFIIYTADSIATTFFVTAGTFGAMSIYGYKTQRDLSKWSSLLFMALIGLILAGLVNLFMRNDTFSYIISGIGVLVFVGLTAYDVNKLKNTLNEADEVNESTQKLALIGALSIYLDFINLFIYLLRILGTRRR